MGRLVSVSVGMPQDVQWQGKTIRTGIWKTPVDGSVMVRRLNIDCDGQGHLNGHGGEQRAGMVYQTESCDYWTNYLKRDDLTFGHSAKIFTVSGLGDDEVCIGDRYRIGGPPEPRVDSSPRISAGIRCLPLLPDQFMSDVRGYLTAVAIDPAHIRTELFGALPPINPGMTDTGERRPPHQPSGTPGSGPSITFARSGITVNWTPGYGSILNLAEACDVPTRFPCRSGVCHLCVTGIIAGTATYVQPPLEEPIAGTLLICSAAPRSDLVLDL